jgi:hypothetical protein
MMAARATTMLTNDGPRMAAIARGKTSVGIERKTSTILIKMASTFPPRMPAVQPTIRPINTAPATT